MVAFHKLIVKQQRLISKLHLLLYPTGKSMTTDPTDAVRPNKLACCDGGFTQTWDTVGAGVISHAERA
jgi:hypothetical protein